MTLVTLAAVGLLLRRSWSVPEKPQAAVALRNPFSLRSAIEFGLLFAGVLLLVAIVRERFPGHGYYVLAGLAGLTDVDAITLSMAKLARDGGTDLATAVGTLVTAALANTLVKCGIVLALAGSALRRPVALVTLLVLAAGVVPLLLR